MHALLQPLGAARHCQQRRRRSSCSCWHGHCPCSLCARGARLACGPASHAAQPVCAPSPAPWPGASSSSSSSRCPIWPSLCAQGLCDHIHITRCQQVPCARQVCWGWAQPSRAGCAKGLCGGASARQERWAQGAGWQRSAGLCQEHQQPHQRGGGQQRGEYGQAGWGGCRGCGCCGCGCCAPTPACLLHPASRPPSQCLLPPVL